MSPSELEKLAALARAHFPWGTDGRPAVPADPSPENLASGVTSWVEQRIRSLGFENTAVALHARLQKVVEEVEESLPALERPRLFYRSDFFHLVKSGSSVLDKMVRDWDSSAPQGPRIGFDNFHTEMEDLARFRIVLNFLSDVETVCCKLEEPYCCTPVELDRLSPAQQALHRDFALRNHGFRNLIQLQPEDRNSGERCRKAVFYPRSAPEVKVEVQIQTMLQEAWDKKDHFLIYEPKRRGEEIGLEHRIEIYAMSELLYVADLTFDRMLAGLRQRREATA